MLPSCFHQTDCSSEPFGHAHTTHQRRLISTISYHPPAHPTQPRIRRLYHADYVLPTHGLPPLNKCRNPALVRSHFVCVRSLNGEQLLRHALPSSDRAVVIYLCGLAPSSPFPRRSHIHRPSNIIAVLTLASVRDTIARVNVKTAGGATLRNPLVLVEAFCAVALLRPICDPSARAWKPDSMTPVTVMLVMPPLF